jgi:hypothetical protein
MDKVRVIDGGVEKHLEYNDKYAHGIFIVHENKPVKRNCEIFSIDLGENTDPNEMKQKVTQLEKTGILTTRLLGEHFQYILKDYADKSDIDQLIKDVPPQSHEVLRMAYNLTKMDTAEDLNFLGGALDKKN